MQGTFTGWRWKENREGSTNWRQRAPFAIYSTAEQIPCSLNDVLPFVQRGVKTWFVNMLCEVTDEGLIHADAALVIWTLVISSPQLTELDSHLLSKYVSPAYYSQVFIYISRVHILSFKSLPTPAQTVTFNSAVNSYSPCVCPYVLLPVSKSSETFSFGLVSAHFGPQM